MIGAILKIVRKQSGYTQKELGKLLNLADTTISAYELEKISPDFETILRILRICQYDLRILDEGGRVVDVETFVRENE